MQSELHLINALSTILLEFTLFVVYESHKINFPSWEALTMCLQHEETI